MVRARSGKNTTAFRRRLRKRNQGYFLGRKNLFKQALITAIRAGVFAYRDRRQRKRLFRRLWILRINAACRARGLKYSTFIAALQRARVDLDRKALAELAVHDPVAFDELVRLARQHLPAPLASASSA
ncbi:MAG: 50S ribosomal protein L20 [Gemmatales bacterium]|nr:50S ribosomal protein L20 [Gemmatales bacterium]MDW8223406.1 50S ribosomal protein L20 [Gemmatales bacterium]